MKKLLLLLVVLLGNVAIINAQSDVYSLIGDAIGGWQPGDDIPLDDMGDGVYKIEDLDIEAGPIKFRKNGNWNDANGKTNWGGSGLSGVAVLDGGNIQILVSGVYTVTFNINTLEYSFESFTPLPPTVKIYGSAFGKGDSLLTTTDNENFTIGAVFTDGEVKFESYKDKVTKVWGGTALSGTVVDLTSDPAAAGIVLTAGKYNVSINLTTGAYSFVAAETVPFPSIGIIGVATTGDAATGWEKDIDMMTEDGINYKLMNVTLFDGAIKFRQDNGWDIAWGGTAFPLGDPSDLDITAVAGTYDIFLNRFTGAYSFVDSTLSTEDFSASASFSIYPNPVSNGTLYFSEAQNVSVYDLSGRLVAQKSNAASVDVSGLVKGIYLVKTSNGVSKQFIVK